MKHLSSQEEKWLFEKQVTFEISLYHFLSKTYSCLLNSKSALQRQPLMLLPKRIKQNWTYRKALNILCRNTPLVSTIKITPFNLRLDF